MRSHVVRPLPSPAGTEVVVRRSPTASALALAVGLLGGAVELVALWRARLTWRAVRWRP